MIAKAGTSPATFFNSALKHYLDSKSQAILVLLKEEQDLLPGTISTIRRCYMRHGSKFVGMYSDYHLLMDSTVYKAEPAFSEYNISGHIVTAPLVLFENPGPVFHPEVRGFTTHYVLKRLSRQAIFYHEPRALFTANPNCPSLEGVDFQSEMEILAHG